VCGLSKLPLGSHLVTWDFGTFCVNLNGNTTQMCKLPSRPASIVGNFIELAMEEFVDGS
jgi:hypothetical protein